MLTNQRNETAGGTEAASTGCKSFGDLIKVPPGRFLREVFQARPVGKRPRARRKQDGGIIYPVWERLWIPQEELEDVAGAALPSMLPL